MIWLILIPLALWAAFELGFNRGLKWAVDCHNGKRPPVGARLWW